MGYAGSGEGCARDEGWRHFVNRLRRMSGMGYSLSRRTIAVVAAESSFAATMSMSRGSLPNRVPQTASGGNLFMCGRSVCGGTDQCGN